MKLIDYGQKKSVNITFNILLNIFALACISVRLVALPYGAPGLVGGVANGTKANIALPVVTIKNSENFNLILLFYFYLTAYLRTERQVYNKHNLSIPAGVTGPNIPTLTVEVT